MKDKYLTTEPPLDQPEIINYTHVSMKRDSKQKWDHALWVRSYKESETEWRNRMDDYKSGLVEETHHLNQQSQDDNNDH